MEFKHITQMFRDNANTFYTKAKKVVLIGGIILSAVSLDACKKGAGVEEAKPVVVVPIITNSETVMKITKTPDKVTKGDDIDIEGEGFSSNITETKVTLAGVNLVVTAAANNKITVKVADGAKDGFIVVVQGSKTATSATMTAVLEKAILKITNAPTTVTKGEEAKLGCENCGTDLAALGVTLGGVKQQLLKASDKELEIKISNDAKTGVFVLTRGSQTATTTNPTTVADPVTPPGTNPGNPPVTSTKIVSITSASLKTNTVDGKLVTTEMYLTDGVGNVVWMKNSGQDLSVTFDANGGTPSVTVQNNYPIVTYNNTVKKNVTQLTAADANTSPTITISGIKGQNYTTIKLVLMNDNSIGAGGISFDSKPAQSLVTPANINNALNTNLTKSQIDLRP